MQLVQGAAQVQPAKHNQPPTQVSVDEYAAHGHKRGHTERLTCFAVIHQGTAYFVEVADNPSEDIRGQVTQVLTQIDMRLSLVGSGRTRLLQVTIFLTQLDDVSTLNALWDEWVPEGHAPARACVQAGLAKGYLIEMIITAAVG